MVLTRENVQRAAAVWRETPQNGQTALCRAEKLTVTQPLVTTNVCTVVSLQHYSVYNFEAQSIYMYSHQLLYYVPCTSKVYFVVISIIIFYLFNIFSGITKEQKTDSFEP